MALQPAIRAPGTLSQRQLEALIDALGRGEHPEVIAKRLHPNSPRVQRRIRKKLELECLIDPRIAQGVAAAAKVDLLVGLKPVVRAMVRRGARGRMDAARIILEASGFHNPRVKHEHSGEVTIKLDMPRPKFEQDEIVDADVVE